MYFTQALGTSPTDLSERLFDMVHSKTPSSVREHVQTALMDEDSPLRVLFATKVVGMGLDISCRSVVHFGPPHTIDDYLQQIGRAGRDDKQAHAIMLYTGQQLRNVEASMLQVIKTDGCIRELSLKAFGAKPSLLNPQHLCCNRCAVSCGCGDCSTMGNDFENYTEPEDVAECTDTFQRHVSEEDRRELSVELYSLKEDLDKEIVSVQSGGLYVSPDIMHGLSEGIIHKVIENAETLYSVDDIIDKCHVNQYGTACRVVEIFSAIFADMDADIAVDEDA